VLIERSAFVCVGAHEDSADATVGGLEQGYVVCPSDKRFLLLFTFLKRNKNKKIMVCAHTHPERLLPPGLWQSCLVRC
jgi:hypothetical protein